MTNRRNPLMRPSYWEKAETLANSNSEEPVFRSSADPFLGLPAVCHSRQSANNMKVAAR